MSEQAQTRPSIARTFIISAGALAAALGLFSLDSRPPTGVVIVAGLLVVSPLLNFAPSLLPQLLARALWWQSALLGLLVTLDQHQPESALAMFVGSAVAIAAAGTAGLWNETRSFVPVAFRRTLLLSLILALADFEALALYGSIFLEERSSYGQTIPFFVAAGAMGVSIFGLYRLKLWGLAACLVCNVAIAGCALTGVFDLPGVLVAGLTATAVAQVLLPLPLVRRMMTQSRLTT